MYIIPHIYEYDTTLGTGTDKRIGSLPDALKCKVTEERNGEFYLEMTYPAAGLNADLLKVGRIINAGSRPNGATDPFRIATLVKKLDGTIDITAYHISYDLTNVIVMPFTANTITAIFTAFGTYGIPSNDFIFTNASMSTGGKPFTVTKPTPLRSLLFGSEGSLVDKYGGEFRFEGWRIWYYPNRGTAKNVTIAYGKNLSAFKATDENGKYDSVIPFAVYNDTTYYITDSVTYPTAPVVESSKSYGYPRTIAVDFSENFTDTAPTDAALKALADSYISANSNLPMENIASGYVDLRKLLNGGDTVDLCDTIHLSMPMYDIYDIQLKVIRTVYDALKDEYESLQVGDKKITLSDTLAELMR